MLVSVIVPNYNHQAFLSQRLDSIFEQTYAHFEVIILDDYSTDNSKEIIERYRGNQNIFKIIYNDINTGSPFIQWAKGIREANGEYIWIAESDDWAECTFLEEVMKYAYQFPKADFLYTNSIIVRKDKTTLMSPESDGSFRLFKENQLFKEKLLNGIEIYNGSAVVFKRIAALPHLSQLMNYYKHGDYFLWVKIALNSTALFIHKPLNYFRHIDTSVTKLADKSKSSFNEIFEIFKLLLSTTNLLSSKEKYFFYNCWALKFTIIIKKTESLNFKTFIHVAALTNLNIFFCYKLLYHKCAPSLKKGIEFLYR